MLSSVHHVSDTDTIRQTRCFRWWRSCTHNPWRRLERGNRRRQVSYPRPALYGRRRFEDHSGQGEVEKF